MSYLAPLKFDSHLKGACLLPPQNYCQLGGQFCEPIIHISSSETRREAEEDNSVARRDSLNSALVISLI